MENKNHSESMLDLLLRPAFCVQDGVIVQANRGAQQLFVTVNDPVAPLIASGQEEYGAFQGGCLYLTLRISGQIFGASVVCGNGGHIFILEQVAGQSELQCIALAAQELREPLAGMMTAADRLLPLVTAESGSAANNHAAQMNRRMFQLLRIISNMSDTQQYAQRGEAHQDYRNISALFDELFANACHFAEQAGYHLQYSGLQEAVYSLADREQLERAVYNLVSNAMKFSQPGSTIDARLTRSGNKLRFSIEDAGCGIGNDIQASVFTRYLRAPALEDPRHGLGLGLVLVRYAAAAHGGAVLMDQPHGQGTRFTMTMAVRQSNGKKLQSPILQVDYTGEHNHGLVELSDVLPASLYETK